MVRTLDPVLVEFFKRETAIGSSHLHVPPEILLVMAAQACQKIQDKKGNAYKNLLPALDHACNNLDTKRRCMTFIQACIGYVEHTYNYMKRSPLVNSPRVLEVWRDSVNAERSYFPMRGWVAIWRARKGDNLHCGIVSEVIGKDFISIEGGTRSGLFDSEGKELGPIGIYPHGRTADPKRCNMDILGFLKAF